MTWRNGISFWFDFTLSKSKLRAKSVEDAGLSLYKAAVITLKARLDQCYTECLYKDEFYIGEIVWNWRIALRLFIDVTFAMAGKKLNITHLFPKDQALLWLPNSVMRFFEGTVLVSIILKMWTFVGWEKTNKQDKIVSKWLMQKPSLNLERQITVAEENSLAHTCDWGLLNEHWGTHSKYLKFPIID